MKISIIVPIYNAAKYLRRCLDSCLSQTYDDYEVICVNDGSTDESGAILDSYRGRIRVVTQNNSGVVTARNAGIEASRGEWLCFVDSDDWLASNALDTYIAASDEDVDIVVGNHNFVWGEHISVRESFGKYGKITGVDYLNECLGCLHGYIWGKIIRRKLCVAMGINTEYKLNEDLLINIVTATRAKKVVHLRDALYYFYMEEGPAKFKRPHSESVNSVLGVNIDIANILKAHDEYAWILSSGYIKYLVGNIVMAILRPYYSAKFKFIKKELLMSFIRAPFKTLKSIVEFRSLGPSILISMLSLHCAKSNYIIIKSIMHPFNIIGGLK